MNTNFTLRDRSTIAPKEGLPHYRDTNLIKNKENSKNGTKSKINPPEGVPSYSASSLSLQQPIDPATILGNKKAKKNTAEDMSEVYSLLLGQTPPREKREPIAPHSLQTNLTNTEGCDIGNVFASPVNSDVSDTESNAKNSPVRSTTEFVDFSLFSPTSLTSDSILNGVNP
jgi:hypothetical protein